MRSWTHWLCPFGPLRASAWEPALPTLLTYACPECGLEQWIRHAASTGAATCQECECSVALFYDRLSALRPQPLNRFREGDWLVARCAEWGLDGLQFFSTRVQVVRVTRQGVVGRLTPRGERTLVPEVSVIGLAPVPR